MVGSSIANAWMYDGDVWNNIKPLSAPRERPACTLVQTDEGVSTEIPWLVQILGMEIFRTIQNQHYSRLLLFSNQDWPIFKHPFFEFLH